jgi:hypothetical protein
VKYCFSLQSAERAAFRRSNSTGGRGPGRPPVTDIPLEELFAAEDSVCSCYHYYFHCATHSTYRLLTIFLYFFTRILYLLVSFEQGCFFVGVQGTEMLKWERFVCSAAQHVISCLSFLSSERSKALK